MEYSIKAYVDDLFRDAPDTQRAYEMKMELIQNLTDKYNDLVHSGKSPEDAYNITIYGIGDISELLEEMRREEAAQQAAAPQTVASSGGASYYKAMYYFRRRSAGFIAVAVSLYIFSVIPVIVLGVVGMATEAVYPSVLGVGIMFALVAVATGLIIWNATTKPKASDPPEVVIDLYMRKNGEQSPVLRAIVSGYWPLVAAVYLLLSFMTHRWDITWIIFVIAPFLFGIISAATGRKH